MSVCMYVKQQTDDLFIIICNCIYSVVINCGWNNNVAVKIVACWNWNVFTSSSWLDRHGEFVVTIHVRRDPPHSNNPVRSSIFEWECNVTGQPIWFRPLKSIFSTCFHVVVAQQWYGRDVVWGFGKRTVGGAQDGDWRRWLSSSDVTFLRKSQGLVKNHSYFMQAVCILLWIDCFESYMVVTYPLDLSLSLEISVLTIWDL